jgi:DNA-binding response OmpR family regulator
LNKKVLLIEDDTEIQELIKDYLKDYDFICDPSSTAKDTLSRLKNTSYDIIILDLMLPDMDGFDLLKKIKEITDTPVIISSARGDIGNKIYGFELGIDDYLAKPYEPRELVLRIENILRKNKNTDLITIRDFKINKKTREVYLDNYPIDFTKVEFDIFVFLVENTNCIISREQIINIASLDINTKNRTIDMHISNIRYKIGDDSKNPKYIKSIWGIGYKFVG